MLLPPLLNWCYNPSPDESDIRSMEKSGDDDDKQMDGEVSSDNDDESVCSHDEGEEGQNGSSAEYHLDIKFEGYTGPVLPLNPNGVADSEAVSIGSDVSDTDDIGEHNDSAVTGCHHKRESRRKAAERRLEEESISKREKQLMDSENQPETVDDFERGLMATPNSSRLWIEYMAFKLGLADVQGARSVANQALQRIGFREEMARLDVWKALINLEYKYGSSDSLQDVTTRACANMNPKYIHLHRCKINDNCADTDAAELLYAKATKKFKGSKKVWMAWQRSRLERNDEEGARELLKRSMHSLPEHKHVCVVQSFALAAFEQEKLACAREVFEGLIGLYPKRLDIWNVWVDQEEKAGQPKAARALLCRMTTLPLSIKKMQAVFTRWLKFELKYGDEQTAEDVKAKAKEYMKSKQ